eukprot:Platyproteum_vivax@DN14398_c0_g1_i1.p1
MAADRHISVRRFYRDLFSEKEEGGYCCNTCKRPEKYIADILNYVPDEVRFRYAGCGAVLPLGLEGIRMVDLGCGAGRDCYIAAALVGLPQGSVRGVDMTLDALSVLPLDPYLLNSGHYCYHYHHFMGKGRWMISFFQLLLFYWFSWVAHYGGVCGHIFNHYRPSADDRVISD